MLSTIGRAAVRRVVAGGTQSTNRSFQSVWHLQHVGTSHNPKDSFSHPKFSFSLGRLYTTATKVAPKSQTTKSKTARPKKAVAKKALKKPAKKAAKKKTVKKPAKKVAKKKPVKTLTEEQVKKVAVKELKAKALSLPKQKPYTAWAVLLSEHSKEHASSMRSTGLKDAAARLKSLSPAELESYNHIANQNKAANQIALKQWIESHTPEQIRIANNARVQLKTKDPRHAWQQIPDDRQPLRPRRGVNFFTKERYASGDLKGISLAENARLIGKEWAALSPSARKTYEDLAAADKQRYAQEFKTVFNRDPEFIRRQKAA